MGKQWKQWQTLFSWAPKSLQMVTAAMKLINACSLEEKAMTNLDSVLKSRDVTLPTKFCTVKAMVFPVVMYGCESWTIKKAESCGVGENFWKSLGLQGELWCWRKLLRVPWTARRSNQSIPKKINHEYSLEGLMLKLKLQYFGHLIRASSVEKTVMLEKIEGRRRRGWQRMRWDGWMTSLTQWTWVCATVHRIRKSQTQLSNWTTTTINESKCYWTNPLPMKNYKTRENIWSDCFYILKNRIHRTELADKRKQRRWIT